MMITDKGNVMKNKNIILFSSGISEKNGTLLKVKELLEKKGYSCSYWRDLFAYAHDPSNIALLPSLIKKIPTFDYAILLCEGHDHTTMIKDGISVEVNSMRDNVLFEIGLCSMALGLNRTILLCDENVYLPEDLIGKNKELAIPRFIYDFNLDVVIDKIDEYIKATGHILNPIVIGAASSSAEGYLNNFILRTLENLESGVMIEEKMHKFSLKNVFVHIHLPNRITSNTTNDANSFLSKLKVGNISNARNRSAVFRCNIDKEELHIYDFPTSVVTSYHSAKMILDLDADDECDEIASIRFTNKELHLFESTLLELMKEEYVSYSIYENYEDKSEVEKKTMIDKIMDVLRNRVYIDYFD